jgi:hypothetical protein
MKRQHGLSFPARYRSLRDAVAIDILVPSIVRVVVCRDQSAKYAPNVSVSPILNEFAAFSLNLIRVHFFSHLSSVRF